MSRCGSCTVSSSIASLPEPKLSCTSIETSNVAVYLAIIDYRLRGILVYCLWNRGRRLEHELLSWCKAVYYALRLSVKRRIPMIFDGIVRSGEYEEEVSCIS
jgi:hypothetical protein